MRQAVLEMSNKKDEDTIELEDENSFEFNEEEIPVGPMKKPERRRKAATSRAVTSENQEYFDIE